jgi:mono/diheme cytochrome c family protein
MSTVARNYRPGLLQIILVIVVFLIAACGRGTSNAETTTQSAAPPTPTRPFGQFTAVGEQSILTQTNTLTQSVQSTGTTSTEEPSIDLARGEAAYVKNKCGDCHGAAGEGVADKGEPLTEMSLALAEFDNVLRTGGGLGNSHIFGRSAISPSGMEHLYGYVQALGQ